MQRRSRRYLVATLRIAVVFLTATLPALAFDDIQTWHTASIRYHEHDRWGLGAVAELRFNDDAEFLWFARAGHTARFRANDRWSLNGNVSYIRGRSRSTSDLDILRLELAATPVWTFGNGVRFDLRSRLDRLIPEGSGNDDLWWRFRPRLTVPWRGVRSIVVGNETLYSSDRDEVFQNRLYPFGVRMPVGRTVAEFYVMIFSNRIGDDWNHDLALGANWSF